METKPKQGSTLEALREAALKLARAETETDPVPEAIERMCAARVGKPITKRDAAALEEQFPGLQVVINKQHGVQIEYWTWVQQDRGAWNSTTRNYDETLSNPDNWDEPQRTRQINAIKLAKMGVPISSTNRRGVVIRRWIYGAEGGATRWPTVEELRDQNKWCYGARDERNQERARAVEALVTEAVDVAPIAVLVDELNERAAALRVFLKEVPSELRRAVLDALKLDMKEE